MIIRKSNQFDHDYIADVQACIGLRDVVKFLNSIADFIPPVLLSGESGVGKEWLAHYLHLISQRENNPFIAINISAFEPELVYSELCGYIPGAFTGANINKTGFFQKADNGTLFIDEINSCPLSTQTKLLRIFEQGEFNQLGSTEILKLRCRLIFGSNKYLLGEVKNKNIRKDFYYRISPLEVFIPSLRKRLQDIPILATRIVSSIAKDNGIPCPVITEDALALLLNYKWPGNVRELKNILTYPTLVCPERQITDDMIIDSFNRRNIKYLTFQESLDQFEKNQIEAALISTSKNVKTAEKLGIPESTLRDKIKKYKINSREVRKNTNIHYSLNP